MDTPNTVTLDISQDNAPAVYQGKGLDKFFDHIKANVINEVPDLTTKKGRDRIASLAAQVSRSKTAVEKPGRDYLKRIKEMPKLIEKELRDFVEKCDELRDQVRKPLDDWEAEQERQELERRAAAEAEAARLQLERDHEFALLLNKQFDIERQERAIKEAQERHERELAIAREAEARALAAAEAAAQAERIAALERERELKQAAERAQHAKEQAEARAAEAERQAALAYEKSQQRAHLAALAATVPEPEIEHKRTIHRAVMFDLIRAGRLTEAQARELVKAIVSGDIRHVTLHY